MRLTKEKENLGQFMCFVQTLAGSWSEPSVSLTMTRVGQLYREDLMVVLTSTEDGVTMLMDLATSIESIG